MQVGNPIPGVQATRGARRDEASGSAAAPGAAASAAEQARRTEASSASERQAAPLRAARQREQGLSNTTVAGAQRTLNYLDELQQRLKSLQERLARRVADGQSQAGAAGGDDEGLLESLRASLETWQARREATSGYLDDTLRFDADGQSRVRFRMRGMSSASLDGGRTETLSFQARGSRRTMSVVLPEGGGAEAAVRQLDRTLAPAGVRASLDAAGEPVFSVAENRWAGLQSSLSVAGGGIRFPAGQAQPVRLQRQEALDPAQWGVGEADQARRTLREVSQALERVQRVAESLRRLLASEASAGAQDADWAAGFVGDLSLTLNSASYETYVAIAPALGGISRSRVVELLSLG
ncbi:hypothetical protein [Rubrivivax gelatinosus]|uniref:Uncharacterized protein n=1 Tax=Rubrivivax gelatinosus TaxID=28068 RepID=A0A4R2MEA6_RUBGE|nr:hypothetical protein [Rubrivivax gelatinosus]MBK1689106.1 hypothetical protein [Rubrivivax gelatinosus]TCP03535.1 hypothetical protein EV684_104258 [Rubrivivax gelatinosus]